MSDYTPTDAEVREDLWHAYWSHNSYERMIRGDHTPVTRAEFDHLIAKVRAEEREKADREPSDAVITVLDERKNDD